MKLLTIIAEAALERRLTADLASLGARGWTIVEAHGHGRHGDAEGDMLGGGNIRIEVIAPPEVVAAVVDHVRDVYFEHWGLIVFSHDVDVVRSEKFKD